MTVSLSSDNPFVGFGCGGYRAFCGPDTARMGPFDRVQVVAGQNNSGKSSLINALTGQQSAVVSATPGTTTDPVLKTMEIHGLGPCVLIDTPGFDDEGDLGILRVQQSRKMLEKTDLAVLLLSEAMPQHDEIEWFRLLEERHIPTVVVRSKADLVAGMPDAEAEALFGQRPLRVSASNSTGLDTLREALIRNLPEDYNQPEITGSLASAGDVVMLVMPQDIQAPKGRLILPQVQTIRELLDKKCRVVCCTTDQIEGTLSSLAAPPKLIITDSQVFSTVYALKPAASLLTSFSVLFARYKGDIDYFVESAPSYCCVWMRDWRMTNTRWMCSPQIPSPCVVAAKADCGTACRHCGR